jgi:hypothetical protein
MLAHRLTRRGVTLSSAALAAVLTPSVTTAGMPATLLSSTMKSASATAAGQGAVAGIVSANVASLTQGMLKFLLLRKLQLSTTVLLAVTLLGGGAICAYHASDCIALSFARALKFADALQVFKQIAGAGISLLRPLRQHAYDNSLEHIIDGHLIFLGGHGRGGLDQLDCVND